ncbi:MULTISPECIES: replication initiator protein A [unclassified Enterococcus]|uniref:replication initiator protein A n=1 Tax=unclassified Enterococcus TaxID=2608891 RepID=UPI003F1FC8E3
MVTKRFTATRKYNELYYQFPKVFITSDKYRSLSDKAKIAFMVFRSRLDLAFQRNQVDSQIQRRQQHQLEIKQEQLVTQQRQVHQKTMVAQRHLKS